MTKDNFPFSICIMISMLLFAGCGGELKPDGLPKLYPLTLTLTQDGTPLAGASVALFADDGEAKWTIGGTTDASGKMSPMTHGKFPGIPDGTYKVCVRKIEAVAPAERSGDSESQPVNSVEYDLVDIRLQSPVTTTLTLEAGPGKKSATLDVGKPIREQIKSD